MSSFWLSPLGQRLDYETPKPRLTEKPILPRQAGI
ncbi:hypothetical protein CGRA01v4_05333 [Colletotrichum graminicola]|nr:hypothetical protein CGRA01v4_05333 [Colletotrichum graminicola]